MKHMKAAPKLLRKSFSAASAALWLAAYSSTKRVVVELAHLPHTVLEVASKRILAGRAHMLPTVCTLPVSKHLACAILRTLKFTTIPIQSQVLVKPCTFAVPGVADDLH